MMFTLRERVEHIKAEVADEMAQAAADAGRKNGVYLDQKEIEKIASLIEGELRLKVGF